MLEQCDINAKDADGVTALMWACQHGWESITTQLLELEVDKSALDNNQMSVLMYAIQADLQNVAIGLIMQDVNVHIVGNKAKFFLEETSLKRPTE